MKRFLLMIFFAISSFFISAEEQVYDEGIKAYIVDVQINKNQTLSITETLDYYTNSTDKHVYLEICQRLILRVFLE